MNSSCHKKSSVKDFRKYFNVTPKMQLELASNSLYKYSFEQFAQDYHSQNKNLQNLLKGTTMISSFAPLDAEKIVLPDDSFKKINNKIDKSKEERADFESDSEGVNKMITESPSIQSGVKIHKIKKPSFLEKGKVISQSNESFVIDFKQFIEVAEQDSTVVKDNAVIQYSCKYCWEVFVNGCALGGHISKVHKGLSKIYSKKVVISHSRLQERCRSKFLKDITH